MAVRAIRGATRLGQDSESEMAEAVVELLTAMIEGNELESDDLISVLFTATPDLRCAFPAAAARGMGLTDVPLMCAQELDIPGAMPFVIRVMMHAETDRPRATVWHPYLRGTDTLRAAPEPGP
ncbi:MAG: chorismate mutase [Actinobacteria bacterium]|nr:chorismate mutase [Actinomycetota bacterium]